MQWRKVNADKAKDIAVSWRARNPERRRQSSKEYRAKPGVRERQYIHNANRRALQRNAPGKFSIHDVRTMMEKQNGCCNLCDCNIRLRYHIDHVVALVNGGSNWPSNLQLLCPTCNLRKGRRTI